MTDEVMTQNRKVSYLFMASIARIKMLDFKMLVIKMLAIKSLAIKMLAKMLAIKCYLLKTNFLIVIKIKIR